MTRPLKGGGGGGRLILVLQYGTILQYHTSPRRTGPELFSAASFQEIAQPEARRQGYVRGLRAPYEQTEAGSALTVRVSGVNRDSVVADP
jgi:hypothetical protein